MEKNEAIAYAILVVRNLLNQDILKTDEKDIYHILKGTMLAQMEKMECKEALSKAENLLDD